MHKMFTQGLIKYYHGEGVGEMEGGVTQFCFVEKGVTQF